MKLMYWSVNADTCLPEWSTLKVSIHMCDDDNPFDLLDEIKELIKKHNDIANRNSNQNNSCDVKHSDSNLCLRCENCVEKGDKCFCNYDGNELLFDKYTIECDNFKSIHDRQILYSDSSTYD